MRIVALDSIRCVAIIFLLTAHIGQAINHPIGYGIGIPDFYHVTLGGLAVTIFLVLSGYVLEFFYGNNRGNYFAFICKRCLKIYPIYYLSLLLGIGVYLLHSYHNSGMWFVDFKQFGLLDVICSLTGGYAFVGRWGGPFVATSWFVGLIVILYCFFPFLSSQIRRRPFISFIILLAISSASRYILGRFGILPTRPLEWFPLCRVFEFSVGIYLAVLFPAEKKTASKAPGRLMFIVSFLSELSFPLFLVHVPLMFLIKFFMQHGICQFSSICIYLFISLFVSWGFYSIDKMVPRSLILKI